MTVKLLYLKFPVKMSMENGHMRMTIRNLITHGIISLDFVKSKRNIADFLIKGLMHQKYLIRRGE